MSVNEGKNLWERWEKAIKDYKTARENFDSEWLHDWPRRLLVLFMEQISKNTLQGNFDALLDKIIEALQIACGFERVRIYFIDEKKTDELVLHKTSIGHQPLLNNFRINIDEKDHGDAIKTLKSGNPLSIEDVSDAYLYLQEQLNITGPYAAIPLLIEGKPYGLVAADKTPSDERCKKEKKPVQFYEYQEHFEAFARVIMSAIENRKISDQRRQKIVQLESINKIDEIIQSEDEEEKLLKSLTEYSGQLVNADGGHLKIKNTRTEKLERVASYGQDITPEEIKDKPEHIGFSNHVFQTKQPLLLGDVTTHEIMQRHKEYCRENGYAEYLKCLENRKSALIVPLITRKDKIIGVLDLHARKENQFSEADKENLEILVNSVIHALDKVQQIKEQKDLFLQREKVIQVMHEAMGKTDHLPSLLEIIRNSIFNSEIFKDIEILCLSLKNPQSGELRPASSKCAKSGKDCDICMTNRQVVIDSLEKKELQYGDRELALPILSKREPIGVLYLKDKNEIILTGNEKKLLDIIEKAASILITTTMNYDRKIRQMTAIYEAGKLTATSNYQDWFNDIMEKVMDIFGRKNRNFHLILLEEDQGEQILRVKQTSDLFVDGKKISIKKELLGEKVPIKGSLSGKVINEKKFLVIPDIQENAKLPESQKQPFFQYKEKKEIRSEIAFPLNIKEGDKEKVIGTLVIDSIIPHDFENLDKEFVETIAQYLAISVHNQQLYDERAHSQDKISQLERRAEMEVLFNYFFHEIKNPLQEIKSAYNIIKMKPDLKNDEFLERIGQLAERSLSIYTESIQNFSQKSMAKECIGIKQMIDNSLIVIQKTIGLTINITGNFKSSDIKVNCYRVFIEMAFREIINNAVKFSEDMDKLERYLEINIESAENIDHAIITFKNSTLRPIPEDKIRAIFNPFVKGVEDDDRGMGLGLALVKFFIDRHNGKIEVGNVQGEKAVCIVIEIPKNF